MLCIPYLTDSQNNFFARCLAVLISQSRKLICRQYSFCRSQSPGRKEPKFELFKAGQVARGLPTPPTPPPPPPCLPTRWSLLQSGALAQLDLELRRRPCTQVAGSSGRLTALSSCRVGVLPRPHLKSSSPSQMFCAVPASAWALGDSWITRCPAPDCLSFAALGMIMTTANVWLGTARCECWRDGEGRSQGMGVEGQLRLASGL